MVSKYLGAVGSDQIYQKLIKYHKIPRFWEIIATHPCSRDWKSANGIKVKIPFWSHEI